MNGNDVRDILALAKLEKENRNMKTSHTKGPWHTTTGLYGNDGEITVWGAKDPKENNCSEFIATLGNLQNHDRANASLIAAAPDILEALERVIKWHESGCDISRKTLLNIEALIAKVKND